MLGKVDVVATCEGVGMSGRVGSIRLAIAMCLRCFVDAETIERMRLGKTKTIACLQNLLNFILL
jgi:ribosomal protein S9